MTLDADIEKTNTVLQESLCESFAWRDLTVTVKDRTTKEQVEILSNSDGLVKKGEMIALMGPSGSGKTTLLNVLASRKAAAGAAVGGEVLVNGASIQKAYLRELSTYVEQEDSLIGSLTVEETIRFAAALSAPKASSSSRQARVETLIRAFGLTGQRNQKIGTAIQKGISGGQKRRVSIASQLITRSNIIFLDEPTSGLDSVASYETMLCIKRLAEEEGLIVVASIHQPSTRTFNLFDRILLLSRGKNCYSGSLSGCLEHFTAIGHPIPEHTNPAEYLLDQANVDFLSTSSAADLQLHALHSGWTSSPSYASHLSAISSLPASPIHIPTLQQSANLPRKVVILLNRLLLKSYRDPLSYGIRLAMYIGLAIMMGTVWLRLGSGQENIQPLMNAIFFSGAFMSFMAVAYIPAYLEDLASYNKEQANGLYGPLPFVLANFLVGVPFIFVIALIFSLMTYWLVNFHSGGTRFSMYLMWLFLDLVAAESLVVLISSLLPIFVAALAITAFSNGLWMCVNGFLVSYRVLNVFWKYSFYWIDYQRYVLQGMMFNEFGGRVYDCDADCNCMYATELAGQCKIQGDGVLRTLGYGKSNVGLWVGLLLAITVAMRCITWAWLAWKTR